MTEQGRGLIKQLRTNQRVRDGFDISSWSSRSECGTTGCIAGWACMLYGDAVVGATGVLLAADGSGLSISGMAANILGLDLLQRTHLFMPWRWKNDMLENPYLFNHLSHNEHPSLDTIEAMKKWAWDMEKSSDRNWHLYVTPDAAANALEFFYDRHPTYID